MLRRYERERKGDNFAMLAAFDGLQPLVSRCPAGPLLCAPRVCAPSKSTDPVKRLFMQQALGLKPGAKHRLRWSRAELQA